MTNISTETKMNIKEAVEVLKRYEATKTEYSRINFAGVEDFPIDEIEMLDFLFENCPETLETLKQVCEHYKEEFKKSSSSSWLIMQTSFALNKTYHFGWLNNSKVEKLDSISDISEIPMKDRYIKYLNILKTLKPDIEQMFIDAYNQCQPHLNFLRIEQTFSYIYDELEYITLKPSYVEFYEACPHRVGRPYFSRSNYGYYIVDTNGHYSGQIFLMNKDIDKTQPLQWWYTANISPDRWHGNKALADITVDKLRELRDIAGFSNLDWEVVYVNMHDIRAKDPLRNLNYKERLVARVHEIVEVDIPKGQIRHMKQASKDISQKYAPIVKGINQAWRAKQEAIEK